MLYCFVADDLRIRPEDDPLSIQAAYAKRLGAYCCLSAGAVTDREGRIRSVEGQSVLLRATCTNLPWAVSQLEGQGAVLFEPAGSITTIEHWDEFGVSAREILSVPAEEFLTASFSPRVRSFLLSAPRVFFKTRKKGFSVKALARQLLDGDARILALLRTHCPDPAAELILSELLEVSSDSLGKKESRHFVYDAEIINSSRPIRSLKHTVPQSQLTYAQGFVKRIAADPRFPRNYVLDVGQFGKDGESFVDVVELNPVTSSLCYVNNSIFTQGVPELAPVRDRLHMGLEYCYDALTAPHRYIYNRCSGVSYTYQDDAHYSFL